MRLLYSVPGHCFKNIVYNGKKKRGSCSDNCVSCYERVFVVLCFSRAHPNNLYTAKQVHLLPGYPSNASGSLKLQIAVYVQQPLGMFLKNVSGLPSKTLLNIILQHKSELGASIGAIILDARVLFKPTTSPPTSPQTEDTDSGYTGWLLIAACLGAVVIFVVIILAIW